jgi:hypothetical protein
MLSPTVVVYMVNRESSTILGILAPNLKGKPLEMILLLAKAY